MSKPAASTAPAAPAASEPPASSTTTPAVEAPPRTPVASQKKAAEVPADRKPLGSLFSEKLKAATAAPGSEAAPAAAAPVATPPPAAAPAAATPPPGAETPAAAALAVPPVVPPAPVVEKDAEVEAEIAAATATMTAAHKRAFTQLRYSERDHKRKAAQLERELAEIKEKGGSTVAQAEVAGELEKAKQEAAALRSKVESYEKRHAVVDLEGTDEYQNRVGKPREEIATKAQELATKYKLDVSTVLPAFTSGDPEVVSQVAAAMTEQDKFRLFSLVEKFQEIQGVDATMRANSQEELSRIRKEQAERSEQQTRAEKDAWNKALDPAWEQIQEEFPVLQPVDGDPEWAESLEAVRNYATPDRFGKLTTQERVTVLHRAAAFPLVISELDAAQEEITQLQDRIARLEKATPSLGAGSGGEVLPPPAVDRSKGAPGFGARAAELLKKASSSR